jgi:hypothetical protein
VRRLLDGDRRPDRRPRRPLGVPEAAPELLAEPGDAGEDRLPGLLFEHAAGGVEAPALLDRQAERRRHGQPEAEHPGDAAPLVADHLPARHRRAVEDDGAVGDRGQGASSRSRPSMRSRSSCSSNQTVW